jgi:hypothetical protein
LHVRAIVHGNLHLHAASSKVQVAEMVADVFLLRTKCLGIQGDRGTSWPRARCERSTRTNNGATRSFLVFQLPTRVVVIPRIQTFSKEKADTGQHVSRVALATTLC